MNIKRTAAALAAFSVCFSSVPNTMYAADSIKLDKYAAGQLSDLNGDGKQDSGDLAIAERLSLDLTKVSDISYLKYADSCESISFENGSITDFSVLKEMKNLRTVSFSNLTIDNFSFLENTGITDVDLYYGVDIKDDDRVKYLRMKDYTIAEGHAADITVYPRGLFEGVTGHIEINYGDVLQRPDSFLSGCIVMNVGDVKALKQGETEYSFVNYEGETVKTAKITVVPADVQDFPLREGIIQTIEINSVYWGDTEGAVILNSDDSLWLYDGKKYTLAGENVKQYSGVSLGDKPLCIWHTDGRITLDGTEVLEPGTVVKDALFGYDSIWAATENGELYYISYDSEETEKELVSDDCVKSNLKAGIFCTSESECFFVETRVFAGEINKYAVGKIDFDTAVKTTRGYTYIRDNDGNLYQTNGGKATLIETGVEKILEYVDEYSIGYEHVCVFCKDGDLYVINNYEDLEISELTSNSGLVSYDEYTIRKDADKKIMSHRTSVVPSFFKEESDRYGRVYTLRDENKTEYISHGEYYGAVTNSQLSYGVLSDDEDYIILVVRTDGSLWEYHVGEQKFVEKSFGKAEQPKYSSDSIIKLLKYLYGSEEKAPENCDMNDDGIINLVDLIVLKKAVAAMN